MTANSTAGANDTWTATTYQSLNPQGPEVNQDVWGPSGTTWSQKLDICSPASWNVTANFTNNGGAIQTYPDVEYQSPQIDGCAPANSCLTGNAVSTYNTINACFGEKHPTGGEWDYGYDMWLGPDTAHRWNIEIMVWNDWTDTGIYPPADARAVTIGGVAYHTWKGDGSNEWIYTRDDHALTGCNDMLGIYGDLVAHPSTSGMTSSTIPWSIEYGVEIAGTNGSETFNITNSSLTTS